jgi:hypothetical protein
VTGLLDAAGPSLVGILAFGSRVTGSSPGAASAWDLFCVVTDYSDFYRRTRVALGWRRSAPVLAALNRILPPSVLHLPDPDGPGAKVFVIREDHLAARLRARGADHFCRGRLFQRVDPIHARDADARDRLSALLAANRRGMIPWMRPFLAGPFDADGFCRGLLATSYSTEIRREDSARVEEVFAAQREALIASFGPLLELAADQGELIRVDGAYRYRSPAGAPTRWRGRAGILAARVLATLRWPKYLLTFDGWLDYIVAKVERRVGVPVELTERERRWPLLLLWPKFFRVMRARRRDPAEGASS